MWGNPHLVTRVSEVKCSVIGKGDTKERKTRLFNVLGYGEFAKVLGHWSEYLPYICAD